MVRNHAKNIDFDTQRMKKGRTTDREPSRAANERAVKTILRASYANFAVAEVHWMTQNNVLEYH